MERGSETAYYQQGGLSTVTSLSRADGSVRNRYGYGAFGQPAAADIDHWTSPLVALIWWALPGASLGVAIVLANRSDGESLLPAGGTAAMLLLTIGTGEALRRRASHERAR